MNSWRVLAGRGWTAHWKTAVEGGRCPTVKGSIEACRCLVEVPRAAPPPASTPCSTEVGRADHLSSQPLAPSDETALVSWHHLAGTPSWHADMAPASWTHLGDEGQTQTTHTTTTHTTTQTHTCAPGMHSVASSDCGGRRLALPQLTRCSPWLQGPRPAARGGGWGWVGRWVGEWVSEGRGGLSIRQPTCSTASLFYHHGRCFRIC